VVAIRSAATTSLRVTADHSRDQRAKDGRRDFRKTERFDFRVRRLAKGITLCNLEFMGTRALAHDAEDLVDRRNERAAISNHGGWISRRVGTRLLLAALIAPLPSFRYIIPRRSL
jgi:hypothetical protein